MNEQIRKIEAQAWEQVNRTNGLVRTEDFNQKFAELIVRECALIVETKQYYDERPAGDVIKEHFGVEE
jgi:hypothetical protein